MIRSALFSLFAAAALGTAPALAQETATAPDGPVCWVSNLGFSEGSVIRGGRSSIVCRGTGVWEEINIESATVCIYKNESYVLGSIIAVPFTEGVLLRCNQSGSWGVNQ